MVSSEEILLNIEEKMLDALGAMEKDFAGFRTGKASPALVENIVVDYYGSSTKLRDIAGISTPEPRLIVIQPWDQTALANIEKSLHASSLGISPVNDGRVIRLPVPELNEERRLQLAKETKKRAEEARVEIRNHRRHANDEAKKAHKNSSITEDDLKEFHHDVQELTDNCIKKINSTAERKEKELLEI